MNREGVFGDEKGMSICLARKDEDGWPSLVFFFFAKLFSAVTTLVLVYRKH